MQCLFHHDRNNYMLLGRRGVSQHLETRQCTLKLGMYSDARRACRMRKGSTSVSYVALSRPSSLCAAAHLHASTLHVPNYSHSSSLCGISFPVLSSTSRQHLGSKPNTASMTNNVFLRWWAHWLVGVLPSATTAPTPSIGHAQRVTTHPSDIPAGHLAVYKSVALMFCWGTRSSDNLGRSLCSVSQHPAHAPSIPSIQARTRFTSA
ncbi:hypothetical protein EDB92DRAFT_1927477 [Lactarius akahatsu]|uniref:Uncharacterized protein n=1 Tax=Lactarius akahatsu TaxID=416441 RepID=A0AAD4L958_9AGAM|nr:hypothetical protein EDB92DRAFT_1927477 [Lactarius akahatsu]